MRRPKPDRYQVPARFHDPAAHPLQQLDRAERRAVIAAHARMNPRTGNPVWCKPSRDEVLGIVPRKQAASADGKPIFDSREAAEAAAAGLQRLGTTPMRAYQCRRGTSGHWHLTSRELRE